MGEKDENYFDIFYIEDRHNLRNHFTIVTVFIEKWHHYNKRMRITFVEGYHESWKEAEKAILARKRGEPIIGFPEDYPKTYSIVSIPEILSRLAEGLVKATDNS